MWTGADWRPILGTSVDSQVSPVPLTTREEQLLLSQWMHQVMAWARALLVPLCTTVATEANDRPRAT